MKRFAVVHASIPGGNPRACLAGWYEGSRVEPSYLAYSEALAAAEQISRAHDGAEAQVVTADRKLLPEAWQRGDCETEQLRTVGDFIAGMTDTFAIARHQELVGPVNLPDRF